MFKNGNTGQTYGTTSLTTNGANIRAPFSTQVYLEDVAYGDYFEIFVRNTSSTDACVLNQLSAYVDSR